jgi:hypothetical protein
VTEPGRAASKDAAERNARWNVIVGRLPEIDE